MMEHVLYILTSKDNGPIYIGETSDLLFRMTQHRMGRVSNDALRIDRLVYTESYDCPFKARSRAKALRSASRQWVEALISGQNPTWQNLMAAPIQNAIAA
ncbi:MAG: GIY-YIG nuclease family protein [Litorimonas sp.]